MQWLLKHVLTKGINIKRNVRSKRDPEAQAELDASVAEYGILQPLQVTPELDLISGEGRLLAALKAGLETVPVIITDRPLSDSEFRLFQLTENLQRSDLSDSDIYRACDELLVLNPTWTKGDLANHLKKSPAMVTRILSVNDLIPEARAAFLAGKFRFGTGYPIAKLPPERQSAMLALHLSGGDARAAAEKEAKAAKKPADDSVKATSIRIALGDAVITVKGVGLTLSLVSELLEKASKEAGKALSNGYTVLTAQRVWADRAAKAKG